MAQSIIQEANSVTGIIGAQAASRYAGATVSGAPTSGTFAVGDFIVDQTGFMWVCTSAGSPGTWVKLLSGAVSLTTGVTGTLPVANGGTGVITSTGSGANVLSTSPTLTTPNLGTPSAVVLTSGTGLPLTTGVTGTLGVTNGGTGLTATTVGGIPVGSSTTAFTNLAIGSNGTVLTSNGTTATWAAAGGPVSLIATVSPSSSSSFSFTSIPATYKNLKIFVAVPVSASSAQNLYMTINGATSGYYGFAALGYSAAVGSLGANNATGFIGGGNNNGELTMTIEMPDYTSTNTKGASFTWGNQAGGAVGAWSCISVTSAITTITISSSVTFTGGNAYLYGFN